MKTTKLTTILAAAGLAATMAVACGGGSGTTATSTGTTTGTTTVATTTGTGGAGGEMTTTTGTGGTGGVIGENLGASCVDDATCSGGMCIKEDPNGWPGGFCTGLCDLSVPDCEGKGVCLDVGDPSGMGFCFKTCAMGGSDCNSGYACSDPLQDGATFICFPACETNDQCPVIGTCDPAQGFCVKPEADCANFQDDDSDGLTDCEDPTACQGTAACTPGNTATGHPCTKQTDCKAAGGDPACLDEVGFGWPKGSCSEFCNQAMNDCGDPKALCLNAGLASGNGLCVLSCAQDADCPTPGYACKSLGAGADKACLPACKADNQCAMFCNADKGLCTDTDEDCSNGMDDDGDSVADCEDLDCAATCGPQIAAACMAPPVAMASSPGNTTGGTNLFAGSCTGSGSPERVFSFTPGVAGQIGTLDIKLASATDQGFYVRTACGDGTTEIGCMDLQQGGTDETLTLVVTGGVPLTIIVDGFAVGEDGSFTLSTKFTPAVCGDGMVTLPEQCDDGNVVSSDGCDATCHDEPAFFCMSAAPAVIGSTPGDTTGGTNKFEGSCSGGGALERIFEITPAMSGMMHVVLKSASDQGVYIRTTCADDTSEVICVDDAFNGDDEVFDVAVTGGVPLTLFVDGFAAAQEGPFTLQLSLQ